VAVGPRPANWTFPDLALLSQALDGFPAATRKILVFVPLHISVLLDPRQWAQFTYCKAAVVDIAKAGTNIGVIDFMRPTTLTRNDDAYWDDRAKQGRPLPWVELRLIDDDGKEVPWDGESTGEIEVRGPWIAASYFRDESGDEKFDSGWLRTGDIAAVDVQGSVQITDRAKDVIKSGGEWISSVELENEMMSHPDVVEAAVIAKPDERWAERPLCCVVLRDGASTSADELLEHLRGRVAKWWLPDEFAFVDEVPKTSVGKFDKKVLRARLTEGTLEGRESVS